MSIWWLAILWTYTEAFPRPFDDWKNALFYGGAGILIIAITIRRGMTGPVAAHLPSPRKRGPLGRSSAPPVIPLLIVISYFLICAASIAVAPTGRYEGLLELARLILWAGLAWVFAQCSQRTWLWLMRLTVISGAAIAGLTWLWKQGAGIWPYETPFLPAIGHITYYGDFMALSLVMAVGLFALHITNVANVRHSRRVTQQGNCQRESSNEALLGPRLKVILFAGVTICCMLLIDLGLALAATRASLVGLMVGAIVALPLAYVSPSPRPSPIKGEGARRAAILALVFALNLAAIFYLPTKSMRGASPAERLEGFTAISQKTVEVVSSGRWHTYITSLKIVRQRPVIGWGPGSFRFVYPEFAHQAEPDALVTSKVWYMHPHNEVLHQAVELGFPGALLFFMGFAYLLYRGIRTLDPRLTVPPSGVQGGDDGGKDANRILLIMALCGLVAAFVSWQFSTNFLFPVSRMMTALYVGVLWRVARGSLDRLGMSGKPIAARGELVEPRADGKPRDRTRFTIAAMAITAIATLFLLAYQASLFCVQKEQVSPDARTKWMWAARAVRLAPGAFDPLFVRAASALQTQPPSQAEPAVEALYKNYPYVPAVLHMMGYLRARQGNIPEARKFLQHALANDPANDNAKQLLDALPPAH